MGREVGGCCRRLAIPLACHPEFGPQPESMSDTAPPPTSATTSDVPAFGWSAYAERVNGRFAMVGFAAVLLIEACSGDTFLHWAGLVP